MRILLIESSYALRESLVAAFRRAGFAIDAAETGDRGFLLARRNRYDVILLDDFLPGADGLELLARIQGEGSDASVLILTSKESVEDCVRGLQSGADDCVRRPFSFAELLARVQALVRRRYRCRSPQIRVGDLVIDTAGRRVMRDGVRVSLTRREFQILEYLARRRGEIVSRLDIEDHVYGEDDFPNSNAVDSAICLLRKKLGQSGSRRRLVHTRRGLGYSLDVAEV